MARNVVEKQRHFLITQHWKTFQWSDLNSRVILKTTQDQRMPFYFRGKVFTSEKKPVADSTLITFYLNKTNFSYDVYTHHSGEFEFPLFLNFGDDEVFYSVRYKDEIIENAQVLLTDDSVSYQLPFNYAVSAATDLYYQFSKTKSQVINSFQYYLDKQKPQTDLTPVPKEKKSMLHPDFSVSLDKYSSFTSIIDIINEVVPLVRYNKINGKNIVRVFLNETSTFSRRSPLYIIDGIMTDSTAYFLGLNPAYVSRISILQSQERLAKFGSLGKNGIIVVETKIPDHASTIPRTKRSFLVAGLNSPLPINTPDYSKGSVLRIPDIRPSLYWNPDLKTEDNGETFIHFYTSDGTGKYIIHIEGITEDGRPFIKDTPFNVSF